jgi:predicted MPP superfamily phosphohydrolase
MGPARLAAAAVFATLALGVVGGGHFYIAKRLVLDPALPDPWRTLGLGAVGLGFALLVLQPIAERVLARRHGRWIAWPAAVWMGTGFVLTVLLGASDALLWLGGASASAAALSAPDAGSATAGARAAWVFALGLVVVGGALRAGLRPPATRRVELTLPRWPRALDGLRIVQISDIHIGPLLGREFAAHLVERVNRLEPDLVAVTGDLVDGSVRQLHDEVAPFAGLRARHGVFFVTGNHDHYSGARSWVSRVAELGLRPLRNEHVTVERDGAAFDLAGVDDHHGSWMGDDGGEDLDRALAGRDPERPVVLLAHDPSTWKRASRRGVDLQLSGHTHGGQIWPFGFLVRLAVPFVAGLYRRGDAQLYVSRGTGFWGPPMRLFAPAEITEITLASGSPPAEA